MWAGSSITGSGGSGVNYWRLNAAEPGNIELNPLTVANGIFAKLPTNVKIKLILSTLGASDLGAFIHLDGLQHFISGVGEDAGGAYVTKEFNNGAGLYTESKIYDTNAKRNESSNGNDISVEEQTPAQLDRTVGDLVTGKNTQYTQHPEYHFFFIKHGVTEIGRVLMADSGFNVDGGGAPVFRVEFDGKIHTNQFEALAGIDATIIGRVPIRDAGGVITGYVPVMANP